jgi:hypothetical protein
VKPKTYVAVICVLLCASAAQARVKASGTLNCGKPDLERKIDIRSDHSFVLNQSKCSADKDKPFEISGVRSANGVSTVSIDVQENRSRFHGYYIDTMENGDKGEYSFQGTATMKDGVIQLAEDSWALVAGTGKLMGAKGKGTCEGTGATDGSVTWKCEGEYTLANK